MKLTLRRRYALAFLSLSVSIVAVFTAFLTLHLPAQEEQLRRAGLRAAATALDVLAEERARGLAVLAGDALYDAVAADDRAAVAARVAALTGRTAFAHMTVFARDGALLYADAFGPGVFASHASVFLRGVLATGEPILWRSDGLLNGIAAVDGPAGTVGAVQIGLSLQPLARQLAHIDDELAAAATDDAGRHYVTLLAGAGAILLLSVAAAIWHARGLSRPIERLGELTRRYARGDYAADADVRRDDEIGALADEMRRMARSLRDTTVTRDELERAVEEALRASRKKSEFLAVMSHELRTPLNAIIGFSQMMRSETLGPIGNARYREYAGDIHVSAAQLLEMVNEILDSAKFESGRIELHEEEVELQPMVEATLRLFAERAARTGLGLQADLPDDLPLLRADRRMVRQMLTNLLSNAVKFTPDGGAVTVRGRMADDTLLLSVSDTGIGMAPEDIPKALTPFVQIDSPRNREHAGTGLGLPLVKSLVELHGGALAIESALGAGTTLTLSFPPARTVPRSETAQTSLPLWAAGGA